MVVAAFEPGDELGHGVHLIAGEVEVGDEGESVERCRHAESRLAPPEERWWPGST